MWVEQEQKCVICLAATGLLGAAGPVRVGDCKSLAQLKDQLIVAQAAEGGSMLLAVVGGLLLASFCTDHNGHMRGSRLLGLAVPRQVHHDLSTVVSRRLLAVSASLPLVYR